MATRWGILATGRIASTLAAAMTASSTATLVAVGSRDATRATEFANRFDNVRAHGSYADLINDQTVDAIYVSTPHPQHLEWTVKALEAGKDVLCEKPLGVNLGEVSTMVDAARRTGRLLMEAFMYRTHPQTERLLELIRDGAIGEVRHVHAVHGFKAPFDPHSRLFDSALAGGGIMDVGCYPVSMARLLAGEEPTAIAGQAVIGRSGVDEYATGLLRFPSGVLAQVSTAVSVALTNIVEIAGTVGAVRIERPWFCEDRHGNWAFEMHRAGEREVVAGQSQPTYVHEIDAFDAARQAGQKEVDAMRPADSLGNAAALDEWRRAVGLRFRCED